MGERSEKRTCGQPAPEPFKHVRCLLVGPHTWHRWTLRPAVCPSCHCGNPADLRYSVAARCSDSWHMNEVELEAAASGREAPPG